MNCRNVIVPLVLEIASGLMFGQTKAKAPAKPAPRFEDFHVAAQIPARKTDAGVASVLTPVEFNQNLRDAAREGPNFAGKFAVLQMSCGSLCALFAVVDVETAKIYSAPFNVNYSCKFDGKELHYRLDSRLLVLIGQPESKKGEVGGACGEYYYEWDGRRLKLIRFIAGDDHPLN